MSDYSYLIALNSNQINQDYHEKQVLLAAKYIIPLFWTFLFNESHMIYRKVEIEYEGEEGQVCESYPCFLTSLQEAKHLLEARHAQMLKVLPAICVEHWQNWLMLFENSRFSHIMVDLQEFCDVDEAAEYENELREYLTCLQSDNWSDWYAVLAQANLGLQMAKKWNRSIDPDELEILLCGFEWMQAVPWNGISADSLWTRMLKNFRSFW